MAPRWALALVVAGVIAAWPGCNTNTTPPWVQVANLNFKVKDQDGKEVNLQDYKGRPLLINFWATWCAPCKYEIPILVALADKYRDQNFVVLGISTDDVADDDLRKFIADYKINYPVLLALGNDPLQEAYEAMYTIPISWFVRPDGTVMLKHTGVQSPEWFDRQVQQLLASPTAAAGEVRHE